MIYLDHHATTPVDARVLEAMLPYFTEKFGNAASKHHRFGWEANDAVERARKQVAALIGAGSKDVIFTSGGTEANNLAIKGVAKARRADRDHVVTVTTEHKAVLDPMIRLEHEAWRVTVLPVGASGLIDLAALEAAVTERTALVSVMAANNEIGVLQPIKEAAAIAHAKGAWFHTDAVQAAGRVPFDVEALDVDFASLTAHKIYGPKGVGALYVRRRSRSVGVVAQIDGGGHERGLRSGTLNVPGIVGFGRAAEIARAEMPAESKRVGELRDRLLKGLQAAIDGMAVNGTMEARLPGNLNVSFAGIDGEALLVSLDDVAVSSGAACTQAEPSHVLLALGVTKDRALASLRFGIGRSTTKEEVDYAARKVSEVVARLRGVSAFAPADAEATAGATARCPPTLARISASYGETVRLRSRVNGASYGETASE
jgi:cysteine desulfurase